MVIEYRRLDVQRRRWLADDQSLRRIHSLVSLVQVASGRCRCFCSRCRPALWPTSSTGESFDDRSIEIAVVSAAFALGSVAGAGHRKFGIA